jgi:uncharacterized protein YneF (UPF0154 family)
MKALLFLLFKAFMVFLIAGLAAGFLIGWFVARHKYRRVYHNA